MPEVTEAERKEVGAQAERGGGDADIAAQAKKELSEIDSKLQDLFKARKVVIDKLPKQDENVTFPKIPNGPAVFYETDRHEAWIGIPFDLTNNPMVIMAALDGAKMQVLGHCDAYLQERARREQLKISPVGKMAQGVINKIFKH